LFKLFAFGDIKDHAYHANGLGDSHRNSRFREPRSSEWCRPVYGNGTRPRRAVRARTYNAKSA
jgi:hypothetical protein